MTILRNRLPQQMEIFYVFVGVVFITFSWSIRGFLYQLTSLLLYHTLGDILAIFSYLMAFALLESLVMTSGLVLVGSVLPRAWFRNGFAYKGFITILVAGSAMIALQYYLFSLNFALPAMQVIYLGLGVTVLVLILLIWLIQKRPSLQMVSLAVQERLQIFLYLYIPLGIVGWAVVVLRNLGGLGR